MSSNINTTYNVQLMLPTYTSTGLQTRFKDAGGVQNSAITTISANLTGSNSMFYGSGNLTLNTQNASNDYVIVNNPSGTTVYMLVLTR